LTHGDVCPAELDLCGMLHLVRRRTASRDAVCVNAAVEINVLAYNVAVRSVNGV